MTEVNPLVQKLRKINEDFLNWQQKDDFTMKEYFDRKNNAAILKWSLLKKEGLVISNWRPF